MVILLIGAQAQIKQADGLIKNKAQSYLQMRQAFEWINQNTPENTILAGRGIEPYTVYYAERYYLDLPQNDSNLSIILNADYLVAHIFAGHPPEYLNQYLIDNQDKWRPINAWFLDEKKTQPAVIIYKRI